MSATVPRAEVDARDAFLGTVAQKVEAGVAEIARAARSSSPSLRDAVRSLEGLSRELRVIAEPARAVPVRRQKLDLGGVITKYVGSFGAEARRGLSVEIVRGGAAVGSWDRGHLETMLGELVSNALKYGGRRPVTIGLSARGDRVQLSVANHGEWQGPSPSYARFRRGEKRTGVRGFGVGLWLTRRLAEAHGGTFRVASREGETRAVVSLPVERVTGELNGFRVVVRRG